MMMAASTPAPAPVSPLDVPTAQGTDGEHGKLGAADTLNPATRIAAYFFWLERYHESLVVEKRSKMKAAEARHQDYMRRGGRTPHGNNYTPFDVAAAPPPVAPAGLCGMQ